MKKVLALGMAVVMAASLTACGGGSGDTQTTAASSETTAAAAETTAAAAETTAAAADDTTAAAAETEADAASAGGTWKLGVIGPFTGGASAYGLAVRNGAELAVKEINEAGGINGYQVELNPQDDANVEQNSVNAYNTLKDWGMQMLVGSVTTAPCIAVAEETAIDNMFQMTPSASAEECIAHDNVFRICFSDPDQGTAAAIYMGEKGLATKIGIIYDSSSEYSSGIRESFVAEAANQGLEIVAEEAFTADSATDFSVQIDKMNEAGAELVFLPFYYQEASIVLKQASDKGFAPIFFGVDGMDGILTVDNFDTSLAEGVMLLTPFATTQESSKKFTADYVAAYGEDPNQFGADAYDVVYAIKKAAETAGITPDMSVSDICEAMKKAMVEISVDGLTGSNITWDASGAPTKDPIVAKIVNGVYEIQ